MAIAYSPYSSAKPFFPPGSPTGLTGTDADRVQAYLFYEEAYWNHPETFRVKARGNNNDPVYLLGPRKIIEATNRFLGVDFDFIVSAKLGTPDDQLQTYAMFQRLFRRELFWTKYAAQKRFGLIWGDSIWHITADPNKADGTKVRIHDVHPSRYFPINDPLDETRVVGVYLVDTVPDPKDPAKSVHRRQAYRRTEAGGVTTELALFELGKWDDRPNKLKPSEIKKLVDLVPPTALPPQITSLPVYHIRNTWDSGFPFGSSTLRGIETVITAVNQGVSDQSLAHAFNGLGAFWTDAAPPRDAAGNPTSWNMGPGRVAEVPIGKTFGRISGVDNLDGSISHIKFMLDEAQTGAGVPDIAAGKVDVTVAESGISLRLQLAPILAANAEREGAILAIYDQMFYDLSRMWFPAYEGFGSSAECEVVSVVGDALPTNRADVIAEIIDLVTAKLLSPEEARLRLIPLGFKLDDGGLGQVVAAEKALAEARTSDAFTNRFNSELDAMSGSAGGGELITPPQGGTGTGATSATVPSV